MPAPLSHHSRVYAHEPSAAREQMHFSHYQTHAGQGCCISSDNPNWGYWLRKAPQGASCPTLSMNMEQCCGPAGERCVHGRNAEYDRQNGYNLWFGKRREPVL